MNNRRVRRLQKGHRSHVPGDARDRSGVRRAGWERKAREERFVGAALRGYFRKPFGPRWALVSDAGYNKDFITAQGILDAFRDAELCATTVDDAVEGRRSFESALAEHQGRRDEQVLPMYEFTAELAALTPLPPELEQLLGAVSSSQESMDGFARVDTGVTSRAEFFSDENAQRMLAAA